MRAYSRVIVFYLRILIFNIFISLFIVFVSQNASADWGAGTKRVLNGAKAFRDATLAKVKRKFGKESAVVVDIVVDSDSMSSRSLDSIPPSPSRLSGGCSESSGSQGGNPIFITLNENLRRIYDATVSEDEKNLREELYKTCGQMAEWIYNEKFTLHSLKGIPDNLKSQSTKDLIDWSENYLNRLNEENDGIIFKFVGKESLSEIDNVFIEMDRVKAIRARSDGSVKSINPVESRSKFTDDVCGKIKAPYKKNGVEDIGLYLAVLRSFSNVTTSYLKNLQREKSPISKFMLDYKKASDELSDQLNDDRADPVKVAVMVDIKGRMALGHQTLCRYPLFMDAVIKSFEKIYPSGANDEDSRKLIRSVKDQVKQYQFEGAKIRLEDTQVEAIRLVSLINLHMDKGAYIDFQNKMDSSKQVAASALIKDLFNIPSIKGGFSEEEKKEIERVFEMKESHRSQRLSDLSRIVKSFSGERRSSTESSMSLSSEIGSDDVKARFIKLVKDPVARSNRIEVLKVLQELKSYGEGRLDREIEELRSRK